MKRPIYHLVLFTILILSSCEKNKLEVDPLATVSVLNVVVDGKVAKLNSALRDSCLNMNYKHFTIIAENSSPVRIYPSGSPDIQYFNQNIQASAGDIYSVFLMGSNSSPESLLIKENIPPYPESDIINLRLVNLSQSTPIISVSLVSPTVSDLFTNVNYKQPTAFVSLQVPVVSPAVPYVFQIKNSSGTVVGSYTLPVSGTVSVASSRHRNLTLAIKGVIGGTGANAYGVIALPHY